MGKEGLGSRGRAPMGSGGEAPEAKYAYTICSGQAHFRDVFIGDIRCTFRLKWSLLPPPYSSKNSSNLCKSHDIKHTVHIHIQCLTQMPFLIVIVCVFYF